MKSVLRTILGVFVFLIASALLTAGERKKQHSAVNAETAPTWFLDRNLVFPEAMYVSTTGSGISEAVARSEAASQVAMYFQSRITVSRSTGATIHADGNSVSRGGFSDSLTEIVSDAILSGMRFTEPFLSGKTYHICAYLNRNECAQSLAAQIERILSQSESAVRRYRDGAVSMSALLALREAKVGIQSIEKTALCLSVLAPSQSATYFMTVERLSDECSVLSARIQRQLTVSVKIVGDRDSLVKNTLRQIFSEAGLICLESGARCAVVGEITASESQNQVGFFVQPSISLHMTESDAPVSSYVRHYDKYGHKTKEAAYHKAWAEIAKDLREHFMAALSGV